jgi:uncharacterized protein (UPF0212 family)
MSDIAKCPKCLQHFDNTIAVSNCPKCGARIDGANLSNETFANSTVQASAEEIAQIDSYLGLSILSVFLCCPLGIIALIFSILTLNDKKRGDYSAAISHSALARNLMIASLVLGGISFALRFLGQFSR